MSDDLELGFNSTPLEQGVRRADRALKELEDALQRLETSASKFRNTQDTEFNAALKTLQAGTKKQVGLLQDAQQKALEVLSGGNLTQLNLVREQNRAVQALYEVRLATNKKIGAEELRWWKEQGANIGAIQKLQLKQFEDTTKGLAAAQAKRTADNLEAQQADLAGYQNMLRLKVAAELKNAKEIATARKLAEANNLKALQDDLEGYQNMLRLRTAAEIANQKQLAAAKEAAKAANLKALQEDLAGYQGMLKLKVAAELAASQQLAAEQAKRQTESLAIVSRAGAGIAALQQNLESKRLAAAAKTENDRQALVARAGKGLAALQQSLNSQRLAAEAKVEQERANLVARAGKGLAALQQRLSAERIANAKKEAEELQAIAKKQVAYAMASPSGSFSSLRTRRANVLPGSFGEDELKALQPNLGRGTKGANDMAAAMRKLGDDTGYAHSMARGLASGFNLLWLTWGSLAPLFAGAAISNGFVQVAKTGMAVEHTFATIQHLGENSAEAIAALNVEMVALGKSGPFGPIEIAEAMKTLSLAGLRANEILAVTQDVLNFSVAGTTDLKTAAETLVAVSTAFGMGSEGFGRVADVVSKAAADSMASVESFSESMKAASVINKQYGVSLEDTATGIAALSNLGIKGSAAGTALRNMYADLSGRSIQVAKVLKQVGIEMRDVTTGGMRPMIEVVAELDQKLRNFTAIGQKNLMQALLSERGAKPIVELLQMIRTEATLMNGDLSSALAKANESIANSAGFAAVTAAKMAQTTENQFKALKATLSTSMDEAYKAMQPSLYLILNSLTEVFGSPAFVNALSAMVGGIAQLTKVLAENVGVVVTLAATYAGLKTLQAALTLGTNAWAAATALLTAAKVKDTTATIAQAGAEATLNKGRAAGLLGLARVIPGLNIAVGIGTAAWMAYEFWSSKSSDTAATAAELYDTKLSKSLQDEAAKLERINDLLAKGISLRDATAQAEASSDGVSSTAAITDTKAAYLENLQAINNYKAAIKAVKGTENQHYVPSFLKELRNLEDQSPKLSSAFRSALARGQQIDSDIARVTAASQRRTDLVAKQTADAQKKLQQFGTTPYELGAGGREGRGPRELTNNYTEAIRDNISALNAQADAEIRAAQARYNSNRQVLEAQQQAGLVSDGSYQMQLIALTEQSEAERLAIIQRSNDQIQAEAQRVMLESARIAQEDINNSRLKGKELAKFVEARYGTLSEFFASTQQKTVAELAKNEAQGVQITEEAFMRRKLAAIKYAGEIRKLQDEQRDYWRAVQAERSSQVESDNFTAAYRDITEASSAAAKAEKASAEASVAAVKKHSAQLLKLEKVAADSTRDVSDAAEAMWKVVADGGSISDTMAETYNNFVELQKTATLELAKFKIATEQDVANEAARAYKLAIEQAFYELRTKIEDVLMTAIFEGGKAGKQKLKDYLVSSFKNFVLEVAIRPVATGLAGAVFGATGGNGLAGLLGFGLDAAKGVASGGSFTSMLTSGISNALDKSILGTFLSSSAGYGAAIGTTSVGLGSQAAMLAAQTAEFGAAGTIMTSQAAAGAGSGFMSALGSIPGWGWAGLAIGALLGSGFGKTPGEQHRGGFYSSTGKEATMENALSLTNNGGDGAYARDLIKREDEGLKTFTKTTVDGVLEAAQSRAKALGVDISLGIDAGFAANLNGKAKNKNAFGYAKIFANGELAGEFSNRELGEDREKAAAAFATELSESVAKVVLAGTDFGRTGETAVQTLTRLGDSITAVNHVFDTLDVELLETSIAGAELASKLVDVFGGIEAFNAATTSYYENFYSEGERAAITTRQVAKQLADLGLPMQNTREGFRALVEAQDLTTESGRKTYAELLKIAPAFASITTEVKEVVKSAEELANDAMSALQSAIDREKAYWQRQVDAAEELKSEVEGIFDLLVDSIRQLREEATDPLVYAQGGNQFINNAITAARSSGALPNQDELSNAISAARGGLGLENFASVAEQRFAQMELAGRLEILKNVAGDQLTEAESQLRVAQAQLELLDQTMEYWQDMLNQQQNEINATLSVTEAINQLADILDPTGAKRGISKPGSSSNSIMGGAGGYGRLKDGTDAYFNQDHSGGTYRTTQSSGGGYEYIPGLGAYVSIDSQEMHRDLSHLAAAQLTYAFNSPATDQVSTLQNLARMYGSSEAALQAVSGLIDPGILNSYQTIPAFADGGMHSGGWAMVGEEGPELAFLPPARIYTAGQTGQMLGESSGNDQIAEVVYELKMLRDQVAELTSVSQQSASALNGLGQQPMLVEIAP